MFPGMSKKIWIACNLLAISKELVLLLALGNRGYLGEAVAVVCFKLLRLIL
jgi:hypothetical protein